MLIHKRSGAEIHKRSGAEIHKRSGAGRAEFGEAK
jgi:hypothetical protein